MNYINAAFEDHDVSDTKKWVLKVETKDMKAYVKESGTKICSEKSLY